MSPAQMMNGMGQLKPDVAGSIANLAATMLVINW